MVHCWNSIETSFRRIVPIHSGEQTSMLPITEPVPRDYYIPRTEISITNNQNRCKPEDDTTVACPIDKQYLKIRCPSYKDLSISCTTSNDVDPINYHAPHQVNVLHPTPTLLHKLSQYINSTFSCINNRPHINFWEFFCFFVSDLIVSEI